MEDLDVLPVFISFYSVFIGVAHFAFRRGNRPHSEDAAPLRTR